MPRDSRERDAQSLLAGSPTVPVRDGELVDVDALRAWLAHAQPALVPAGAMMGVRQFPSGFSNLTYLVTVDSEHGQRGYVLRRPPRGAPRGVAHDMGREHDILAALHPLGVPVPRTVVRCDDEQVIGAAFYLMEHVEGVILRGSPPAELREAGIMRELSHAFVGTLAGLHAVDARHASLAGLNRGGNYVERQVQGWTKRWTAARIANVPAIEHVAAWLDSNKPGAQPATLVHNDFKFDNLVLDPSLTTVRAILDWEMATVGDPLMDLGTSLAYWVEAGDAPVFSSLGLGVTALPGSATRAELAALYGDVTGRDVSGIVYYYVFGLFKVAVIAQQIYARYVKGLTADGRFSRLGDVVQALGDAATDSAERGRL